MSIFKAYDIRGIYGTDLTEETAFKIGKAFVDFLECKKLVLGHDMRLSAPKLVNEFIKGANEQGCDVVNIGFVSTDTLYFASGKLDLPGVMFTASHNPPEWNGMKFCKEGASPINYDNGIKHMEEKVKNDSFKQSETKGKVSEEDVLKDFVKHVRSFVDFENLSKLKIAVDAGNGMAGKIIPKIFENSNIEIVPLYFDLDGKFPNHLADPSKFENLKDLQKEVLENECDFGMAFDGDADRVFFINEQGKVIDSSLISSLIIKNILEKNPDEKVIYNLVCSKAVPEIIKENNGQPIKERVGHSYIKETMKKTNAIFGCEHSAHYYYRDNFRADSGIITSVIVLEIISKENKKLSQLTEEFRRYSKIEETSVKVKDKDKKLAEIEENYSNKGNSSKLDGITVEFEDWWFNVRPSNTEPLLRLNLEANSDELMNQKKSELLELIQS